MRQRDQIDELSQTLRADSTPLWARLRTLLREKGVDPQKALLVDFFQDDSELYFGIVITASRRAIQFDLNYMRRDLSEAVFTRWEDITHLEASSPYSGRVEAGLFRLAREGGALQ